MTVTFFLDFRGGLFVLNTPMAKIDEGAPGVVFLGRCC